MLVSSVAILLGAATMTAPSLPVAKPLGSPYQASGPRLKGTISTVVGTVTSTVTPSPLPQSVTVKVNGANVRYSVILLDQYAVQANMPVTVILQGSTFLSVPVPGKVISSFSYSSEPKSLAVSATNGALVNNLLIGSSQGSLRIAYPQFTAGTYNFVNGLSFSFVRTLPSSYDLELPTTAKRDTEGIFKFPVGTPLPSVVMAQFGNSYDNMFYIGGSAMNPNLTVGAHLTGSITKIYTAEINFGLQY